MFNGMSYKQAGVDIEAADQAVDRIKPWVEKTRRPEVLAGIGGFGGFFALDTERFRHPVLVSGTDGGYQTCISQMTGVHDTVGIDLVAMCVNDILVHGAEPLFFLDYLAVGKLIPEVVEELVQGVARGCMEAGCSLIGGETAEMPGFYGEEEYDMAGFAVGAVEREQLIDGTGVREGQVLVGLPSSGLHSNGYSLARKVLLEQNGLKLEQEIEELGKTLGEELLTPTRIYVKSILELIEQVDVRGMAHITGGGITENLKRILPPGLGAVIEKKCLPEMPVFELIRRLGRVDEDEMFRTFNMGIGFIMVLDKAEADHCIALLKSQKEEPIILGKVSAGQEGVMIK